MFPTFEKKKPSTSILDNFNDQTIQMRNRIVNDVPDFQHLRLRSSEKEYIYKREEGEKICIIYNYIILYYIFFFSVFVKDCSDEVDVFMLLHRF